MAIISLFNIILLDLVVLKIDFITLKLGAKVDQILKIIKKKIF